MIIYILVTNYINGEFTFQAAFTEKLKAREYMAKSTFLTEYGQILEVTIDSVPKSLIPV